jgi:hypothetical protein
LVAVVCGVKFVGEGDDGGELVGGEDEGAGEDGVGLRETLEGEGGYNAEIGAGAADGPE